MFKYAAMIGAALLVLGVGSAQAFLSFVNGGYQYISPDELNG